MLTVHGMVLEHRLPHEQRAWVSLPSRQAEEAVERRQCRKDGFAQAPAAQIVGLLAGAPNIAPEIVEILAWCWRIQIRGFGIPLQATGVEVLDDEEQHVLVKAGRFLHRHVQMRLQASQKHAVFARRHRLERDAHLHRRLGWGVGVNGVLDRLADQRLIEPTDALIVEKFALRGVLRNVAVDKWGEVPFGRKH